MPHPAVAANRRDSYSGGWRRVETEWGERSGVIDVVGPNSMVLLRRMVAITILLGILLFPATCSHAAGPHSLFIDPREPAAPAAHPHMQHPASHAAHHSSADQISGHESAGAAGQPASRLSWSDLPSTMRMSLAAGVMLLGIPQPMVIPTGDGPAAPQAEPALRATHVPVDVPPPRFRAS